MGEGGWEWVGVGVGGSGLGVGFSAVAQGGGAHFADGGGCVFFAASRGAAREDAGAHLRALHCAADSRLAPCAHDGVLPG